MPTFTPKAFQLQYQLTFEGAWSSAVALLELGNKLVAGNRDGTLLLWDLTAPPVEVTDEQKRDTRDSDRKPNILPVRALTGHTNGITRLCVTPDRGSVVSASLDRSIRTWRLDAKPTGKAEVVLDANQREQQARRDKKRAEEILSEPGFELDAQNASHVLEGHKDWVTALSLSGDGRRLLSGDDANVTILWDFPARTELTRWKGHAMCGVCSNAITGDGSKAFVAEYRSRRGDFDRPPAQAKIFALDAGKMLLDLLVVQFPNVKERDNSYGYSRTWSKFVGRGFVAAEFSPDGKLLALAQGGEIGTGKVQLIDVETGKLVRTVSGHKNGATDVKFTADGKYLLTAGRDTTLRVIQVDDGKEVAALGKPRGGQFKDWLSAIAISADQMTIAAADIAGLVHVWQAVA
jgi:WD40 repeat protein